MNSKILFSQKQMLLFLKQTDERFGQSNFIFIKTKTAYNKWLGKKLADITRHQLLFGYCAAVIGWTL